MLYPSKTLLPILVCAELLVSGCTTNSPAPPAPEKRDSVNVSTRWIANPSLDLMSPEGTFVRAAMESWDASRWSLDKGMDGINTAGYPGFAHAFNSVMRPDWLAQGAKGDITVGTAYYEVVSFTHASDKYTAGVCIYNSLTWTRNLVGNYQRGGPKPTGMGVWLTFGPDPKTPAAQQKTPPPQQKGPVRRPTDNVFGTWLILDYDVLTAATTLPQCVKFAPDTPPAPAPDQFGWYWSSDPPPVLSPEPGWPDGGNK